jgi:hypothetical protein
VAQLVQEPSGALGAVLLDPPQRVHELVFAPGDLFERGEHGNFCDADEGETERHAEVLGLDTAQPPDAEHVAVQNLRS